MKNKLDIFTHHYFPYYFIILGIVFIPLIVIPVNSLLSVGFFALSFLFITTHYRLRINPGQGTYKEYLWIFGFKKGNVQSIPAIDYIYVNKTIRDEEYGLVARLSTHKTVYMGFIKLAHGESLFCGESRNEEKLMRKVNKIAAFLNAEIRKNYES